jgi:asparagine synthase (glutamine-hydrolysing)
MTYLLQKTGGNYVQAIIDFDLLFNTLADNFLTKVDRASMSQALEVRSPFLDRRRIERARKVPTKRKVTLRNTKILMREIIKDIVPASIIHRDKK